MRAGCPVRARGSIAPLERHCASSDLDADTLVAPVAHDHDVCAVLERSGSSRPSARRAAAPPLPTRCRTGARAASVATATATRLTAACSGGQTCQLLPRLRVRERDRDDVRELVEPLLTPRAGTCPAGPSETDVAPRARRPRRSARLPRRDLGRGLSAHLGVTLSRSTRAGARGALTRSIAPP